MLKKFLWGFVAVCLMAYPGVASAGETDLLIQKLVEKGILSASEAQILQDDVKQDVAKQNAKGANEMLPSWVQTIKLKGDIRLRYQTQQKEAQSVQTRGRVRMRLGAEAKPSEQFLVGAGFASGSDADGRSTNETLGDGFAKDGLYLDYAWGEYKPTYWMNMIGGKYNALGKNYLWYTTDMLWDSDINQEGASVHLEIPRVLMGDAFVNTGYWALSNDYSSAAYDAAHAGMFYGQAGMAYSVGVGLENPLDLKFAGAIYSKGWNDRDSALNNGKDTQTADNNKYEYNKVYSGSAELVYNWPAETSFPIKMAGLFADYVLNPDPADDKTGWATGLKFGHAKVGATRGDWQFKYQYVKLEKYAWINVLPDSDRYSGLANVKGHELILDIGLAKNVSLGLDYYLCDVITGNSLPESIFQADLNFKF